MNILAVIIICAVIVAITEFRRYNSYKQLKFHKGVSKERMQVLLRQVIIRKVLERKADDVSNLLKKYDVVNTMELKESDYDSFYEEAKAL